MKTSSNYGLKLMEGTDNVKRQDFVDNFTKIDSTMKTIADSGFPLVNATGTNAYVGSNTNIKSLTKGTKFTLFIGADASGNCTLNLNSWGVKSIKDSFGNIVTNLKKDIPYNICYNGTDFILQGKGGGGNVQPSEVLNGKTFTNDKGPGVGTMPNNGAINATLNAGQSKAIPKGYTDGGTITVNSLASQTQATAQAGHILSGQSAYVNGNKITGSIPYMNGTWGDQWETREISRGQHSYNNGGMYAYMKVPANHYINGVNWIASYQPDLWEGNIVSGKNIFGVQGSATIESLGGKKYGTTQLTTNGSRDPSTWGSVVLAFTPTIIKIIATNGTGAFYIMDTSTSTTTIMGRNISYTSINNVMNFDASTNTFKQIDRGMGTLTWIVQYWA